MKNGLRVLVKCCERGALQKGGALGITIRVVRHPHSFPGVQEHTTHSKVIETLSDCPVSEAEALGPGSRSHPVRPVEPIPEAASRRARRDQATRSQITHRISCREAAGNADHRVTTECCRWRCPHCADGVACGVDRAVAPGPARWLLVLPIIVEYCGWHREPWWDDAHRAQGRLAIQTGGLSANRRGAMRRPQMADTGSISRHAANRAGVWCRSDGVWRTAADVASFSSVSSDGVSSAGSRLHAASLTTAPGSRRD